MELRYRISSWDQLTEAMSNNSKKLSISVTKYIQDKRLNGTRISVDHIDYGTLFSYIVDASGTLVTDGTDTLTTDDILAELARFGFLISWSDIPDIASNQLALLQSALDLGFDQVRILGVYKTSKVTYVNEVTPTVVAFNSRYNQDWLNNWYTCSEAEFSAAVVNGSAFNLTIASDENHWNWSWLYGTVQGIADILDAQKHKPEGGCPCQ